MISKEYNIKIFGKNLPDLSCRRPYKKGPSFVDIIQVYKKTMPISWLLKEITDVEWGAIDTYMMMCMNWNLNDIIFINSRLSLWV